MFVVNIHDAILDTHALTYYICYGMEILRLKTELVYCHPSFGSLKRARLPQVLEISPMIRYNVNKVLVPSLYDLEYLLF
jgi:hypothetical protein